MVKVVLSDDDTGNGDAEWYFSDNGKLSGPMSYHEAARLVHHAWLRAKYDRLGLNSQQIDFRLKQFDYRWRRKIRLKETA